MPLSEAAKAAKRRYYEKNKARVKARAKQQENERRALLAELKNGKPCARCGGYFHPVCLDFHHRDPETKDKKLQWLHVGLERLLAEVEKCDLLCANCHRLEHYDIDGTYYARPGFEAIEPLVAPS